MSGMNKQQTSGIPPTPTPVSYRILAHDEMNKMTSATFLPNGPPENAVTFKYDALGRRVLRTYDDGNEVVRTRYFYDGLKVLAEKSYLVDPDATGTANVPSVLEDGEDDNEWYIFDTDPSTPVCSLEGSTRIV